MSKKTSKIKTGKIKNSRNSSIISDKIERKRRRSKSQIEKIILTGLLLGTLGILINNQITESESESESKINTDVKKSQQINYSRNNLDNDLKNIGFKKINVLADGSCFYRSIADQIDNDERQFMKYREMTANELDRYNKDCEEYKNKFINIINITYKNKYTLDNYINEVRNNKRFWADDISIQALCNVLKKRIDIYKTDGIRLRTDYFTTIIPQNPCTGEEIPTKEKDYISILHYLEYHYESLKPI